jgi:hypothetical protein
MEYQKFFNSQTMEGIAYQDNKKLTGSDKTAIKTANDYFKMILWLIAPSNYATLALAAVL